MFSKIFFAVLISSVIFSSASAADMEQIAAKLKKGDFSTVKNELIPLAESGDARAQYNLGVSYRFGNGVEKDAVKAFEWTAKAAQNGDVHARVNLASMYVDGRGVQKNISMAIVWYAKAAEQGDVNADLSLAKIYRDGSDGNVDYAKAFEYYSRAADKGSDAARYNLAAFYHYGLGVEKNEDKAKALFASLRPQSGAGNLPVYSTAAGNH